MDFIEIGTSNFNTLIGIKNNKIGLSIKPIKYYLDQLPNKKGCKKIVAAISNVNGTVKVYYVSTKVWKKFGLRKWVRGCNTIND